MRAAAIVMLTGLMAGAASGQTDEEAARTMLRIASTHAAIVQFCTAYYIINTPTAVNAGKAATDVARRVFGEKKEITYLKKELKRRFVEVSTTGERQWCYNQRTIFNANNLDIFLN